MCFENCMACFSLFLRDLWTQQFNYVYHIIFILQNTCFQNSTSFVFDALHKIAFCCNDSLNMLQNQSFRACSLMRLRDHPRDHDNFPTRFQTTLNTTLSSRTAFQRATYRTKWKLCVGSSGQKIIIKIVNVRYSTSLQHVLI